MWAGYVSMVHEMSGEPESVILGKMSFARGLQYQNEWHRRKGIVLLRPQKSKGLKTVL